MSLIAFDYLWRVIFPVIDEAEARVVLFRLFSYADEHGRRMFPGIERLALECRRDPVLVARVLEDALERNVIQLGSNPRNMSSDYSPGAGDLSSDYSHPADGRRVFHTPIDLSLWKSCGKPVESLSKSDVETHISRSVRKEERDPLKSSKPAAAGDSPPVLFPDLFDAAIADRRRRMAKAGLVSPSVGRRWRRR